jgi:glycosyltransferase involved in cell wall biosynthesis
MTMATDPPPRVSAQREASKEGLIEDIGVVVIGRNEGDRLLTCLDSLGRCGVVAHHIVYVDSGSTDGSVQRARDRGVAVIELQPPFTAAKGRNAGARFADNFTHVDGPHMKTDDGGSPPADRRLDRDGDTLYP